jgi:hypothetical protein
MANQQTERKRAMTPMSQVISDANLPADDVNIVTLHTYLLMNTRGGRPSDNARQAVREYQAMGRDDFIHAHYRANTQALRDCGCPACLADAAKRV